MPTYQELIEFRDRMLAHVWRSPGEMLGVVRGVLGAGIGSGDSGLGIRVYISTQYLHDDTALKLLQQFVPRSVPVYFPRISPLVPYAGVSAPGHGIRFRSGGRTGRAGSLGALLEDGKGDLWVLTANHVISDGDASIAGSGYQVCGTGNTAAIQENRLGHVLVEAPLGRDGVDCAMVLIEDKSRVVSTFSNLTPGSLDSEPAVPGETADARRQGRLQPADGRVHDPNATVTITYAGVPTELADIILIADSDPHNLNFKFANMGDSGSMVFQRKGNGQWHPLGLVVGGPEPGMNERPHDYIAVCRFDAVLRALDRQLQTLDSERVGLRLMT